MPRSLFRDIIENLKTGDEADADLVEEGLSLQLTGPRIWKYEHGDILIQAFSVSGSIFIRLEEKEGPAGF